MIENKRGVVFNGHDLSEWVSVNPTRSLLPPVTVETIDVPGHDGARFRKARLGELSIPAHVRLRGSGGDMADVRKAISSALYSMEPAQLFFCDDMTRYYMAIVDGASELSKMAPGGSCDITFRCPDPVAFGTDASASMTTSLAAKVGGNYETRPVITAKPATGSYYRFTNYDTGEYVQVNASFNGTQTLVIDMGACHCSINGESCDSSVVLASDYFALKPGANNLRANSGSATVEWVERWL